MDDLISRKALIEAIQTPNEKYDMIVNVTADMTPEEFIHEILCAYETQVIRCIEDQPPVEAAPVIRCKDCKNWIDYGRSNDFNKVCKLAGYYVGGNGYCCYADMRKKVQDEKIE